MLYRESGQIKTRYRQDQHIFPILQDRWLVAVVVVFAFVVVPLIANEYWLEAILIPFLVFAVAAIGLNLLTGYAGQLSLGTGGFMAVGAYSTFKMTTAFPELNILIIFALSGFFAAGVGIIFGLPSLRIKGSTSRFRPSRRNSSWCGCSTGWSGFSTMRPPARSRRHRVPSLASC